LAEGFGQQQIENEILFKSMLEVDENVTPFILKLNVNVPLFIQIQTAPYANWRRSNVSRTANSTLNEAEAIAKKMNDESVLNI
jgi:ATP-dependent Clp protease ATP-binding subunit ClpB